MSMVTHQPGISISQSWVSELDLGVKLKAEGSNVVVLVESLTLVTPVNRSARPNICSRREMIRN